MESTIEHGVDVRGTLAGLDRIAAGMAEATVPYLRSVTPELYTSILSLCYHYTREAVRSSSAPRRSRPTRNSESSSRRCRMKSAITSGWPRPTSRPWAAGPPRPADRGGTLRRVLGWDRGANYFEFLGATYVLENIAGLLREHALGVLAAMGLSRRQSRFVVTHLEADAEHRARVAGTLRSYASGCRPRCRRREAAARLLERGSGRSCPRECQAGLRRAGNPDPRKNTGRSMCRLLFCLTCHQNFPGTSRQFRPRSVLCARLLSKPSGKCHRSRNNLGHPSPRHSPLAHPVPSCSLRPTPWKGLNRWSKSTDPSIWFCILVLALVAVAIVVGAVAIMVRLDDAWRNQGGRYLVATGAFVLLIGVDTLLSRLAWRRFLAGLTPASGYQQRSSRTTIVLVFAAVFLFSQASGCPEPRFVVPLSPPVQVADEGSCLPC